MTYIKIYLNSNVAAGRKFQTGQRYVSYQHYVSVAKWTLNCSAVVALAGWITDAQLKSYSKVSQFVVTYCSDCGAKVEGMEARLAIVESKLATFETPQPVQQPQGLQNAEADLITVVVTKVCERLIPKLSDMVGELV